ncbi:MAG: hypothetical protein R3C68_06670 [Myxococcota bacterium]
MATTAAGISSSGEFSANAVGTVRVFVADTLGNRAETVVQINPALLLEPTNPTILFGHGFTFDASGGVLPYIFSANGGTIDASTGVYSADEVGMWTVTVTDAWGTTRNANVFVPQPGTLDASYGTNGTVSTAVGSGDDWAFDSVLTADNRLIVVGATIGGSSLPEVLVARFTSTGALDTSFGSPDGMGGRLGYITQAIGSGATGLSVILDANQRIVVGGWADSLGDKDLLLMRLNADGTLDSSFNSGTPATYDLGLSADESANGVWVQEDGKLVAVGWADDGARRRVVILRVKDDGDLDSSFVDNGFLLENPTYDAVAVGVHVTEEKRIVVGGYRDVGTPTDSEWVFTLSAYKEDGDIDTSFGEGGQTITRWNGGVNNADCMQSRAVGSDALCAAQSLVPMLDGGFLLVGHVRLSGLDTAFAVSRYNKDGMPENAFANAGQLIVDVGLGDQAFDAVEQSDGRIVVVGSSQFAGSLDADFALIRVDGAGVIDTDFNGPRVFDLAWNLEDICYSVVQQPDERIVCAGVAQSSVINRDVQLMRIWP